MPNYEKAVIPEKKITHYLLNEIHPSGKHKAAFLTRFGFSMAQWEVLKQALLNHAATYDIASTLTTSESIRYVIEGQLQTPDNRNPDIRSVWAIDTGSEIPRLITAYPLKNKEGEI